MKLWKLSQDWSGNYDTYDSCVVAAETEEEARAMHPDGEGQADETGKFRNQGRWADWAHNVQQV